MKWPWIIFLFAIVSGPAAFGCELCRDATVVGGATIGFNSSIYWMLGGLFTVMTMVGRVMYTTAKEVNAAEAASPDTLRRR